MEKRCLIIGCGGFIGSYLAEHLLEKKTIIAGTFHNDTKNIEHIKDKVHLHHYDLLDKQRIATIITETEPEVIYYLAASNFISPSWEDPEKTLRTNIIGGLYFFEAIRKAGIDPLVEVISSSAVYGLNLESEIPVKETKEFRPLNPYGVSKIGLDMLAYLYWQTYGMKILRVRPFNITGPRRVSDVCSDFARGIVEIEKGKKRELEVGNLETIRDITDVRDAVTALDLLSTKGQAGEAYNLCSGKGYKIREILDILLSLSEIREIPIIEKVQKNRKTDDRIQIGDNSKMIGLGWLPKYPLATSLKDMLEYWRVSEEWR